MVMRDIAAYYKRRHVPRLQTLKILSDGCRAQYKGKNNFRRMATFHLQSQGIAARQMAAVADSRTAKAAMELEQKNNAIKIASVRNATRFLSPEEVLARGKGEFKIPQVDVSLAKELQAEYEMASEGSAADGEAPLGVMQVHDFPQSHHYGGPYDNAGKVPRTKMRKAEAFETARISDYHACFNFCIKEMPR